MLASVPDASLCALMSSDVSPPSIKSVSRLDYAGGIEFLIFIAPPVAARLEIKFSIIHLRDVISTMKTEMR